MTNRETQTLITKKGTEVVYKSWISGKEFNAIQSVYLSSAKLTMVNGQPSIDGFSPTIEVDATNKLIEMLVVSVNKVATNVVELIGDLPVEEYNEVVETLKAVSDKKK